MIFESADDFAGANFTPVSRSFYYYNSFTVGLTDQRKSFTGLNLYPNPASDQINISFSSDKNTVIQVTILDVYGNTRLVMTQPVNMQHTLLQIPCASLANGLYIAQITDLQGNQQQSTKFQIFR
jgi:hypothetical protein